MKSQRFYFILFLSLFITVASGCKDKNKQAESTSDVQQIKHPDWSKTVSIYEVNVRQFTPEGTFEALEGHLPRLRELGTELLWLMPIHPIGEENRKGTLGSYYSVKDYKGINPEFGDSVSFKSFVKRTHREGMKVIIDWVANHSAWDNPLVTQHPEWYAKDSSGNMFSPFDWTDVVKFDFTNQDMRRYMIDAMKYWVQTYDIDGFRCDVAGEVPMDFWEQARKELDEIKPVFMLAEAEGPQFHTAFDMTYGWEFHHIMNRLYKGEAGTSDVHKYLLKNDSLYPDNAYRMYFVTNHDENSWNGTEFERLGEAVDALFAFSTLIPGMPLVYTGQEAAMDKRLQFFEKDPVDWGNYSKQEFYQTILDLKAQHEALHNGQYGGTWERIQTDNDDKAYVILREKGLNQVVGVFNMSPDEITISLKNDKVYFQYRTLFETNEVTINEFTRINLPGWSYKIFYK